MKSFSKLKRMAFCWQILGESMAGISHNAKNSNLPEFGDSVSGGSKALCGLTEAAAQVKSSLLKVTLLLLYSKTT